MATLDEVKGWNPYVLSDRAGCMDPDSISEREGAEDSPGAVFLRSVRDGVVEAVEAARAEGVTWAAMDEHLADELVQIADDAPDVYTHTRWREFVDLGAWQQDLTELGDVIDAEDITRSVAGVALYLIALTLAHQLLADLAEQDEDEEDGEE